MPISIWVHCHGHMLYLDLWIWTSDLVSGSKLVLHFLKPANHIGVCPASWKWVPNRIPPWYKILYKVRTKFSSQAWNPLLSSQHLSAEVSLKELKMEDVPSLSIFYLLVDTWRVKPERSACQNVEKDIRKVVWSGKGKSMVWQVNLIWIDQ